MISQPQYVVMRNVLSVFKHIIVSLPQAYYARGQICPYEFYLVCFAPQ